MLYLLNVTLCNSYENEVGLYVSTRIELKIRMQSGKASYGIIQTALRKQKEQVTVRSMKQSGMYSA